FFFFFFLKKKKKKSDGADIIYQTATKFVGGHHDLCAGYLVLPERLRADGYGLKMQRTRHGNVIGNLECWLLLRSIRSLQSRIRTHSMNACILATFLSNEKNSKYINRVYHTFLESHPFHHNAIKYFEQDHLYTLFAQLHANERGSEAKEDDKEKKEKKMTLHPGIISIVCSNDQVSQILPKKLKYIAYATSFGGVQSSIDLRIRFDEQEDSRLLRFSVGLENVQDLIHDFTQAFAALDTLPIFNSKDNNATNPTAPPTVSSTQPTPSTDTPTQQKSTKFRWWKKN
ncbi:cystathionine gamma-synthase, partial [Reticulomyxa filosa]